MAKKQMVVARPASRTVRVVQSVRRAGGKLAEHRKQTKGMAIAVVSAGLLGWAESKQMNLPKIDALGLPGTYGLLAAGVYAITDSDVAAHVSTGLLSVAVYQAAKAPAAPAVSRGYVESAGAVDFE